jgi:hypothetical protein
MASIFSSIGSSVVAALLILQAGGCNLIAPRTVIKEVMTDEDILCGGYFNEVYIVRNFQTGKSKSVSFRIQIYSDDTQSQSVRWLFQQENWIASVIAREPIGMNQYTTPILLKKDLKVGNTFKFKDVTWKILNIGRGGLSAKGIHNYCNDAFMHIKRVKQ